VNKEEIFNNKELTIKVLELEKRLENLERKKTKGKD